MWVLVKIAHRRHEARRVGQGSQLLVGDAVDTEFELEGWDDRTEVGIAASFAVPVHRPLNVYGTGGEPGEGARHGEATVVVGMDPDVVAGAELGVYVRHDRGDVVR